MSTSDTLTSDPRLGSTESDSELVDFSQYKDLVREVLQVSSLAMLEFRRRTPLPTCDICVKHPERCQVEADTYRCAICSRRRKTCSWKAQILVPETVNRFGVTEKQAEELYKNWGQSIRVDQAFNTNQQEVVDPTPSQETESPTKLKIRIGPPLSRKKPGGPTENRKRTNSKTGPASEAPNKRPRLSNEGPDGHAASTAAAASGIDIEACQPSVPSAATASIQTTSGAEFDAIPVFTPLPETICNWSLDIASSNVFSQVEGEQQLIQHETPRPSDEVSLTTLAPQNTHESENFDVSAIHSQLPGLSQLPGPSRSRDHSTSLTSAFPAECGSNAMDQDSGLQPRRRSTSALHTPFHDSSLLDKASILESQYDLLQKRNKLLEEQHKETTEQLVKAIAQVKMSEGRSLQLEALVNRLTLGASLPGVTRHPAALQQGLDDLKVQYDALEDLSEGLLSRLQKLTFDGSMLKASYNTLERRLETAEQKVTQHTMHLPGRLREPLSDYISDKSTSVLQPQFLEQPASRYADKSVSTDYTPLPHTQKIRNWHLQLSTSELEYARDGSKDTLLRTMKDIHSDMEYFLAFSHSRQAD